MSTVPRAPLPAGAAALEPAAVAHVSHCLRTLRSVRSFHRTDVDPELLTFVLDHAIQAGSGKNRQPWRFIVIREPAGRASVARWYLDTWQRLRAARDEAAAAVPDDARQTTAAATLAAHLGDAPVLIVVCFLPNPTNPADFFGGASVYPAVQNLLLAARAVGLGATLTTLQAFDTATTAPAAADGADDRAAELARRCARLKSLLGIPGPAVPAAVIPLGYPRRPFGTGARHPLASVTYGERWGHPWPHAAGDPAHPWSGAGPHPG